MNTYFPFDFDSGFSLPAASEKKLASLFAQHRNIHDLLAELAVFFQGMLPYDYLMLTLAEPNVRLGSYYFYPAEGCFENGFMQIELPVEKFSAIHNTPPCLVRISSQSSHTPSILLLKKALPGVAFSSMRFRVVTESRKICGLMFISRTKHAYTKQHARWAFSLQRAFSAYAEKMSGTGSAYAPELEDTQILPIMTLPGMHGIVDSIWKVAKQDCPVLLMGETGTGKEVVSDAIVRASDRGRAPYVKINCGCIPDTLIDSELFGHEKGAFTGAIQTAQGRLEQADHGVLLLDELGELPMPAQTRLLRVLQEGTFYRVGGKVPIFVDVRIVAATHRNIPEMVRQQQFREDLFYRLNIFPIWIPPLRHRPVDIPILLNFFIQKKSTQYGCASPVVSPSNMRELCAYSWPGNIRELHNAVERAFIMWDGNVQAKFHVSVDHFSPAPEARAGSIPLPAVHRGAGSTKRSIKTLDEVIAGHLWDALTECRGKISGPGGAAELLGLPANTLRAKLKKLNMDKIPGNLKKAD